MRPLARALFNFLPIRPARRFQIFFKRIALRDKSADRTCEGPTGVHFKARSDLADDIGRGGGVNFAWKFFGDVRIRQTVGLALIAPNALRAAAVYQHRPAATRHGEVLWRAEQRKMNSSR